MSQTAAIPKPGSGRADAAVEDRELARMRMVDTQVRPVKVSDPRILQAMRLLPRERFIPADRADSAYADRDVPLGGGRVLTEPRVIARLIQSLVPHHGERALVVGAGTGYAACLMDALGVAVVALEQNPELAATGRALLSELAPKVVYREGPLADGYAEGGPYALILIDGGVREIPPALSEQLIPGGRIAGVLSIAGRVSTAFLAESTAGGMRPRAQFDVATPLLPELAAPAGFSF